ncbi:prohead core protein serine protease [Flavobacterium phage vB_FspM_immuto_3-5A]|uniref:Prohead core protein serine protease n=1 Tax=Flavobacterium phage vB_FspM_immuto_2-6A TaxID=2801477 RepID=A0A7T8ERP8_9CAUD|nr:prohead core protein serine protease [Flavobacterium phage vB_FspM_immuto_2-6A]QQO91880.1 prohead core protein serine protease [Flavobacterium phage vB_FspM_immuto_2-6A]QQO92118.1 prohead core protein serine protease [Flavobacterium phage vB_FspM_immuto_3-5A]QQO92356.1 prohead core protein serine protease [Flavobacterium phage vB_FspM_immuto_13-6C]
MNNPLLINVTPFKGLLTESKVKPGVFEVTGVMQRAGAKNQNGRIYKREILEQEVQSYIENFVKVGNAYGELDHPESAIVSLKNASHVVKDLWWEGDDLMGKVELLNTPSGNIVKEILRGGHTIGISSRGTGSVTQTNEGTLMVQPDFELVCWDFVSNPSTQGAFMNPISLNEGKQSVGKYGRLDSIINNILRA